MVERLTCGLGGPRGLPRGAAAGLSCRFVGAFGEGVVLTAVMADMRQGERRAAARRRVPFRCVGVGRYRARAWSSIVPLRPTCRTPSGGC